MRLPVERFRCGRRANAATSPSRPCAGTRMASGRNRKAAASLELVMATAVAIPIAGGLLFLGFKICRYVFAALSGLVSMPFV
jgi:hypothetical protein